MDSLASYPRNGDTRVKTDTSIQIRFSEPIKKESLWAGDFSLTDTNGNNVPCAMLWADDKTLRFGPNKPLQDGMRYKAILYNAALDTAGNPMKQAYEFSFTTQKTTGVNDLPIGALQPNIEVFPNPAKNETIVRFGQPAEKDGSLYLYTPQGIQLGDKIEFKAGTQEVPLNLSQFPDGVVWVTDKRHGLPLVILK